MMRSSSRHQRLSLAWRNLGSEFGTFTRALRSSPVVPSSTVTAMLSDRLEIMGNGWPGSTAKGVSTG